MLCVCVCPRVCVCVCVCVSVCACPCISVYLRAVCPGYSSITIQRLELHNKYYCLVVTPYKHMADSVSSATEKPVIILM